MIETEIAWFLISALCRDLTQFAIQYGRNIRIRDAVQDAITLGVAKEIASHLLSSTTDLTAEYNRLISQYNEAEMEFGTISQVAPDQSDLGVTELMTLATKAYADPDQGDLGVDDNLAGISALRMCRGMGREDDLLLRIELMTLAMKGYIASDIPNFAPKIHAQTLRNH